MENYDKTELGKGLANTLGINSLITPSQNPENTSKLKAKAEINKSHSKSESREEDGTKRKKPSENNQIKVDLQRNFDDLEESKSELILPQSDE
jgi:hypothetical protein